MKNKICFRCKLVVSDKEDYYEFNEFHDEEIINIDYCHKECWTKFKQGTGNIEEAMGMLRGLKAGLTKQGMLPEEVVEIQ